MDIILYSLDVKTGARVSLPHGSQSRFHSEGDAVARAEELRGEAAALGDKNLPAFAVVSESSGDVLREIKDAAPVVPPEPEKKIREKVIRAIVIDAQKQEIREEQISCSLASLQKIVGGLIELVRINDETDMYVNEEGLINGTVDFFSMSGPEVGTDYHFAGNAVIVGHDGEGNTTSTDMPLETVRERVTGFMRLEPREGA